MLAVRASTPSGHGPLISRIQTKRNKSHDEKDGLRAPLPQQYGMEDSMSVDIAQVHAGHYIKLEAPDQDDSLHTMMQGLVGLLARDVVLSIGQHLAIYQLVFLCDTCCSLGHSQAVEASLRVKPRLGQQQTHITYTGPRKIALRPE